MSIKTGHRFPSNKLLDYMKYNSDTGVMFLCFKKGKERQIREYNNVPIEVAYKLFYSASATDVISNFSNQIKGKYQVLTVK